KNTNQDAEKLILQDLEDEETTSKQGSHLKYISDVDMNISFTYHEVEEKCRQEFEQWEKRQKELEDEKRKKWKAEREAQEKQNEEEQTRRLQRLEEFEAERIKLELLHKKQQSMMEDELQKEKKAWRDKMMQHEELIMKLQLQVEEEEKAFEEQKAKQRQRLAEQWNAAAVKIQARFRSFLVHKKYAPILKEWKDKIKRKKEIQEEIEREMKEKEEKMKRRMEERKQKEEEKKRQEELERQKYLEQVRRHEEYEKKKVSLRLEREKQLQIKREEQRKLREKAAGAMMNEDGEKDEENITEEKLGENIKAIREQKKEPSKQLVEQEENQTEKMDETSNWMIPIKRKSTLPIPNILNSEKKEHSSQINNENIDRNSVMCAEKSYSETGDLNKAIITCTSKNKSVDFRASDVVENKVNNKNSSPLNAQPNANNREIKDQFSQSETVKTTVFLMEDSNEKVGENWDRIQDVAKYSNRLEILPDDTEKKRLNWMRTCKPWSKIYGENQRKKVTKKKQPRKSSVNKVPPLSVEKIIHGGPWSTLQQVTILTLEDLPECSLSTLSECANLQVLTLRRCGLVALEGLSNCKDLKYINVEENNIQIIDCENLENLCILILNKNHLSSVCGLGGCRNLRNLELSYNRITRIVFIYLFIFLFIFIYFLCFGSCSTVQCSVLVTLTSFSFNNECFFSLRSGLESLKNLQQLIVDHNQLISTKGLCEAPTLMHLDCSFNHLTQVEGIENSGLLQILKLQGNNLQELPRLENHVLLRELYLDDNSISSVRTFSLYWLPLLQILSFSQNSLTELAPLNSCVSLEKLDIRNNRLSDLKSVIIWLNGCHKLSELSLSGNPLLQERTWRSSLFKVLNSLQFLNGENLNYHTLVTTERMKGSESRTFLELCQSQIEENVLLKKKAGKLGIVSSIDDAQRQCWYFNQLLKLSIQHRCAHEYGELNITDRDGPEALQNHLKQTSTDCLQENNLFIMGATENKQVLLDPSERWITTDHIQHSLHFSYGQSYSLGGYDSSLSAKIIQFYWQDAVIHKGPYFSTRLHMAASLIQSIWRQYHARKKTGCTKTENDQFTDASRQKHEAATLIQAFWKGFLLRKKLASALAAVKSDEVEDDYEEITVDDCTFHEAALEKEWLTLDTTRFPSKTLLLSNQLHWPKVTCYRNFLLFSLRSFLKDMGFKDISTAQLMLKRAHKMKPKKFSNKNLDPAVRLALFKNNENKHLPVKPPRKTQPVNIGYFEGKREEFSELDTALDEKLLWRKDLTYQWLHTQVWDYEAASSRNIKCNRFLPELDPAICNGRRVQLVASPVSREDTDLDLVSMTSGSALTQNREKNNQPHRHSARPSSKLWGFSISLKRVV
uniref:Leucine-rich repeat and IQ domain-containing protein 1 n=1 Tax=Apteryx owenii TaxID=8824 RepID=A0A8B9PB59_APTOW